jgi:hypothetical protein
MLPDFRVPNNRKVLAKDDGKRYDRWQVNASASKVCGMQTFIRLDSGDRYEF